MRWVSTHMVVLVLLGLALLATQVSSQGSYVSCPNNGVNCKICREANSANDLSNMPHVNRKIQTVSNDYGWYNLFDCTPNPTHFNNCSFNSPQTPESADIFASTPEQRNDPTNYVDSLAMYLVVAVFMCVFSALCGVLLCIGRCCCCCVKGGTCGKRWPTRKGCWLGFEPNRTTKEMEYSTRGKWGARLFMIAFIFCVFLFIILGQVRGNQGINGAVRAFIDAPEGLANLAQAQATPIVNFAQNVIGTTLVQGLRAINSTINDVVSLPRVLANADCIIDRVLNLPSVNSLNSLLDRTILSINNISLTIQSEVNGTLIAFIAQKNLVQNEIRNLNNIVARVNATMQGILRNATQGSLFVGQINTIFASLKYEINFILTDLNQLDNLAPDNRALPLVADLAQFRAGAPPMTNGEVAAMRLELIDLNSTYYSKLPDYNRTADHMLAFNRLLDQIQQSNLILQTEQSINDTLSRLKSAANVDAEVNTTLSLALLYARSFDFGRLQDIITRANASFRNFGDDAVQSLRIEGAKITSLRNVLPCVADILDAIDNFNRTVVSLPSDLNEIKARLGEFNDTLNDAINDVDQYITDGLSEYTDKLNELDLQTVRAQLDRMRETVINATAQLDISSILAQIHNLTNVNINLNIGTQLRDANESLATHRISNGSVHNVRQLGEFTVQLIKDINDVVPDLAAYPAQGRACNSGVATLCTADAPTCSPRRCITDQARLQSLIIGVAAVQNASAPPVNEVLDTLVAINTTIQIAVDQTQAELNDALESLSSVDTGGFVRQIDQLTAGILNFDPSSTLDQFQDLYDVIGGLDFASARAQIQSLNSSFEDVNRELNRIQDLRNSSIRIRTFLFETLPAYLNQLSSSELQAVRTQRGVSAMILHVTQILDEIILFVNKTASPYVDFGYNLTAQIVGKTDLIDALTSNYPQQYGAIQFFVHLFDLVKRDVNNEEGMTEFLRADDPRAIGGRYNEDAQGNKYVNPSDPTQKQTCLTRECLYNTVDYYTRRSVSDITEGKVALSLTPEQVAGLPYLIPGFICLFGALAVILGLLVKGSAGTSWAACCANLTAGLIFCQMPGIFLFAGSFFVLPLAFGDFCYGIENVGGQLINRMGDNICAATGHMFNVDMVGNAEACTFNMSAGDYDIPFSVSIPDAYHALVGACDAFPVDPLRSLYVSAANRVRTIPYEQIGDIINGTGFDQIKIKGRALGVITDFANNAGQNLEDLVYDISTSIGCQNLGGVYSSVKNALCCETVGAVYWVIASWYLIAWAFILCGCWASLFGRKRFGHALWGPEIQKHDVMARSQPHAEFDDPEPMAVDDHPLEGKTVQNEPVALAPLDASATDGEFVAQKEGNTGDDNTTKG